MGYSITKDLRVYWHLKTTKTMNITKILGTKQNKGMGLARHIYTKKKHNLILLVDTFKLEMWTAPVLTMNC